jgi:phosphoglycolate phosphatase-like HAD superfamily hydrolase/ADP-ribose pyrophosphatase YjhB (NUDIX family)
MIRNILFDWSGTLVDDLPAVWEATNYVFRQAKLEEMTLERFRAEFCLPFKLFYDRHTPDIPMAQLEEWFHSSFRGAQHTVVAIPHAREFLECCQQRKVRMFVLSTMHPEHFATHAKVTGFGTFFERAYTGVLDKRARIVEVLKENGLAPEETLFIGDMQHDIDAAKHGQVHSCAVLTGYTRLEQLRASAPELIVEHLAELRDRLEVSDWTFPPAPSAGQPELPVVTVGALIFNSRGQVLMIRTHKWSNLWGIPGGKVRFGEASVDALRRELKEETNLDVADVKFVLVQDCIHSKEFYRDAHFVLLNYTCRAADSAEVTLNEEGQEYRWVSIRDALELPLNQPTQILLEQVKATFSSYS